jgi:ABC-type multidrug transport system fused ATPase/permease subunit
MLLGITLWVVGIKKAGANIHHEALRTLIQAPLYFFTTTDTGVITNLFSQDLNLIDTELPEATLNTLFCVSSISFAHNSEALVNPLERLYSKLTQYSKFFQALGQAAVMLTSSAYLAIAYPLLGAVLYIVGRFYLRTSRQLRLLDLEAKSPL